ncbi:MAG: aminotransferase class I/II-fold pyridoxal phosphate-dependent enzyme [Phycisphaerae bacterium]
MSVKRKQISRRADLVPWSGVRKMFNLAQKYRNVINLTVGEPDFDTPKHITDAAMEAMKKAYTHYTPNAGLMAFREAAAKKVKRENGIDADPENEVIATRGSTDQQAPSAVRRRVLYGVVQPPGSIQRTRRTAGSASAGDADDDGTGLGTRPACHEPSDDDGCFPPRRGIHRPGDANDSLTTKQQRGRRAARPAHTDAPQPASCRTTFRAAS